MTAPQPVPDPSAAAPVAVRRIGLVVHPRRGIDGAVAQARAWAAAHDAEIVQVPAGNGHRRVAEPAEAASCDVIVAIGGDGTTLHALHAAAPVRRPVLGVACGSLGALTTVGAEDLGEALERLAAGEWSPRRLPGIAVAGDGDLSHVAMNDAVVVRAGPSQVLIEVRVDGQLYVRYAGDGVAVATPAGSSAYTLAAGGPLLAERSDGLAITPLAPHGGCCPPLVVGSGSTVTIGIEPGYAGARLEFDGQAAGAPPPAELRVSRREDHATLVGLGHPEPLLAGLRRRRIIIDSPRLLARDERRGGDAQPPRG